MKKRRTKYIASSAIFASVSIGFVIVYTLMFGTNMPPMEFNLSYIGNMSTGYWIRFIIWGAITATCVTTYFLYTFRRANFENKRAVRALILSDICIMLTVLTPWVPEVVPILSKLHTYYAILIVVFATLALLMFVKYMWEVNGKLPRYVVFALVTTYVLPAVSLYFMGLNGFVEMSIVVLVSLLFVVLNIYLTSLHKDDPITENDNKKK